MPFAQSYDEGKARVERLVELFDRNCGSHFSQTAAAEQGDHAIAGRRGGCGHRNYLARFWYTHRPVYTTPTAY